MRWMTRAITVLIGTGVVASAACTLERNDVPTSHTETASDAININTAGIDELRRIPNIGEKLGSKIVDFREKHGPFRRPEHLLLIDGISDRRFREIRHLIRLD